MADNTDLEKLRQKLLHEMFGENANDHECERSPAL
jgi:hypothetical protein